MLKKILFSCAFFIVTLNSKGQEPTSVTFSNQGKITALTYDFSNEFELFPLTRLTTDGKGTVKELRLNIKGSTLRVNASGKPLTTTQGPFKIEWNDNNQIDRIKQGYETIYMFYYNFDGYLEKVKDGDYNVCFSLRYNSDDLLEKIDYGNYDYYALFSYGQNNRLEYIKKANYDYIWKLYYGSNDILEEIKDDDYEVRAELGYNNGVLRNVSKYNSNTQFILPNQYGGNSNYGQNNGCEDPNQKNTQVVFFSGTNFQGDVFVRPAGSYAYLPSGWGDRISSVILSADVYVTLYENSNFSGAKIVLTSNWSGINWASNWSDQASSLQISYK